MNFIDRSYDSGFVSGMPSVSYRTQPHATSGMPPGIPYIITNEAAERFSYYGMRSILTIFMTQYLMNSAGEPDLMGEAEATAWYHTFNAFVYLTPVFGALIADAWLGKYRTIIVLSIVYCLGHLALALDETRTGLAIGLGLIVMGSGGIKPCVSAHVGDQFGSENEHLISKVFAWFYFSINAGAFVSSFLTPILLKEYGPSVAFGLPGALMFLATFVFWLGRNEFVHIPARPREFWAELYNADTGRLLLSLAAIYVFIVPFWSLFDQTGSSWVLQARHLDLNVAGFELLPSQIQAVNPVLVLLLIPVFSYGIYPWLGRFFEVTPLRRIALGMLLAGTPFVLLGWVEGRVAAGETPSILWQVMAYVLITAAEVMISITALEFAYTQAKPRLKSMVMVFYLLPIFLGNFFTAAVNVVIQNPDGSSKLAGPAYFFFFAGVMGATALVFLFIMGFYRERRFIQGGEGSPGE